jgi:hypothetical protein
MQKKNENGIFIKIKGDIIWTKMELIPMIMIIIEFLYMAFP